MPDFAIFDSHVHLIEPTRVPLSWGQEAPSINRPHRLAELDEARGQTEIDRLVFVEVDVVAGRHFDEVSMVEEMAAADQRISAIVAHAPLELGDNVQTDLDEFQQRPLVKGIRRLIQSEKDRSWCTNDDFVTGVRHLTKRDLHFEICINHVQAASAIELVKLCPDVRFVLDHIAKPDIASSNLDPWRQHLSQMAELPNVWCKMSGLVTEADHNNWTIDDLRPYVDHVIQEFSFDRLMFGSDWPVVNLASSYDEWIQTMDALLVGVSNNELEKFYRQNARSFYRLNH